jgi:hypothetical protein
MTSRWSQVLRRRPRGASTMSTRARTWVVLAGLAGLAAGACEAPEVTPEALRQAIVAGAPDPGDPAIMELLSNKGALWSRCTATLVTPRVLLMAAHCLTETPGFRRVVFARSDDTNFTEKDLLPVQATAYDPAYGAPRQGHDFAIAVLASPMLIRPVVINRASMDMAQGKTVRYVGYGLVNGGDPNSGGIKRSASAPIAQVSGLLIALAPNAHGSCQGDSGGPMLLDDGGQESIVGIGSFITRSTCDRDSFYQRVDTQLAWVDEQLKKYDPAGSGASDAAAPGTIDAGVPDSTPTATGADAGKADVDAAAVKPRGRDASAVGPEPEPEPEPGPGGKSNSTVGGSGGCSYGQDPRPGAALASLLLAAGCLVRRRRGPLS